MSRYRILFTETGTQGGGSFQSLYQMVQALDRDLFEPIVVFVNRTRFYDLMLEAGVETYLLRDWVFTKTVPWFLQKRLEHLEEGVFQHAPFFGESVVRMVHGSLIRDLKRIIFERGVDMLYLNDQIDRDIFGCCVAKDMAIPLMCHLRSRNGTPFTPAKAEFANRHVGAYIPNACVVKEYWEARGVDPEKSFLIYNGMPAFQVEPLDMEAEFCVSPGRKKIVCVSRLMPEKGHVFLLVGYTEYVRRGGDALLFIVGDGRARADLERCAAELGIADRVIFTGMDLRAKEIVAACDVLVQPSEFDSFGRTIPEAMMLGVPVVATDVGSIREIVRHGENGLLTPYGDGSTLAERLEWVLGDANFARELAERAARDVRKNFSIEAMVAQIQDLMLSLIEGKPFFGPAGQTKAGNPVDLNRRIDV